MMPIKTSIKKMFICLIALTCTLKFTTYILQLPRSHTYLHTKPRTNFQIFSHHTWWSWTTFAFMYVLCVGTKLENVQSWLQFLAHTYWTALLEINWWVPNTKFAKFRHESVLWLISLMSTNICIFLGTVSQIFMPTQYAFL